MGKNRIRLKGRLKAYVTTSLLLGLLLALVNVLVYFVNITAGIILSVFVAVYFIIVLIMMNYNKPILMNELISFATQYGQIQRRLLRDLELPHALMDETGKIIWTNALFEEITHKEKRYHKHISTIFPQITDEKLPSLQVEATHEVIEHEGFVYQAKMKRISLQEMVENSDIFSQGNYSGFLIAIYLFDETALRIALQENDDQSLAVGMIYLDNYDEALESVDEVRRSLLTALIERKINKYIMSVDGIVKRLEKDKYLVVLRKKAVQQLKDNKFDLLEDVKTVNIGNEMAVTLSIGIGLDGLNYAQDYEYARTAIDLALGRGGDQAVVKNPDSVSYYGGKSQQMEKNTRVKARVKAHALREIITSKDQVLVMGHRIADVDSFGAAVGIYCVARALGRKANIVLNEVTGSLKPIVDRFESQTDYEQGTIIRSEEALSMAGNNVVLVVVDVNKPSITECPDLLKVCKSIVVLDHHRQGAEVIENATLSYVEPFASSACEMVSEILQYVGETVKIRSVEADCLYSGMMIDTNNFLTKTGVRTFEAAAFLRRSGADVTRVRKMFREDAVEYMAKADAVRRAEIFMNNYAISVCNPMGLASPTVTGAQAANELLNINGIKASFVLTEYQNMIYFSARSIDEVNVQIVMERLGGGGHMNIAGAQMENTSLEVAIGQLKMTLETMIKEGDI